MVEQEICLIAINLGLWIDILFLFVFSVNRFNDDGSGSKAALLSGPPGVGKTTTATLVCQVRGASIMLFVHHSLATTSSQEP